MIERDLEDLLVEEDVRDLGTVAADAGLLLGADGRPVAIVDGVTLAVEGAEFRAWLVERFRARREDPARGPLRLRQAPSPRALDLAVETVARLVREGRVP